jgi:hypothetical protein
MSFLSLFLRIQATFINHIQWDYKASTPTLASHLLLALVHTGVHQVSSLHCFLLSASWANKWATLFISCLMWLILHAGRMFLTAWISLKIPDRLDHPSTLLPNSQTRFSQFDFSHICLLIQSDANLIPSSTASASACSGEAQVRSHFHDDRTTLPSWSRAITPTLACCVV